MEKKWYVVQAYSGYESSVKKALLDRVNRSGVSDCFGEILVPTEEVVEIRGGKKRRSERKFFPGYVLVKMEMNDETWHLVKDVPKVLGFVGGWLVPRTRIELVSTRRQRVCIPDAQRDLRPSPFNGDLCA